MQKKEVKYITMLRKSQTLKYDYPLLLYRHLHIQDVVVPRDTNDIDELHTVITAVNTILII